MKNLGYLLMSVSKKLKYNLNQALNENAITAQQWSVIQQIHVKTALDQRVTANELGQLLDMDKPTMSGIVKRLEQKQLLYKVQDQSDKRYYYLFLTAAGEDICQTAKEISDHELARFLQTLTSEEQQQLGTLLDKLDEEHD